MFIFRRKESTPDPLDELIVHHIQVIEGTEETDEDYAKMIDELKVLMEAKALQPVPKSVSPDTIAIIAANLAGIIAILGFEKANVLTSKAIGQLLKPRS
jgi:hypothetical protein